ncbi:hypothetical protein GC209_13930 [bacterium]|nr:hypothetical protein [bacterium]
MLSIIPGLPFLVALLPSLPKTSEQMQNTTQRSSMKVIPRRVTNSHRSTIPRPASPWAAKPPPLPVLVLTPDMRVHRYHFASADFEALVQRLTRKAQKVPAE